MNIRVDLNYHIKDGTEVVFRSPVDCSQVTGLKVYYPENGATASKVFAFADAHGNNVGDIDHLFAEDVAVKVILDVTTSMAFVQNADTNAYLEGRFDELSLTVDASGDGIAIRDAAGKKLRITNIYGKTTQASTPTPEAPVEMVSAGDGGNIDFRITGKNMLSLPYVSGNYRVHNGLTYTVNEDGSIYVEGTTTASSYFILSYDLDLGTELIAPNGTNGIVKLSDKAKYSTKNINITIVGTGTVVNQTFYPQVELGTVSTDFEAPLPLQTCSIGGVVLRGILVAENHIRQGIQPNYTDKSGGKWVTDEIDLVNKKYIKRLGVKSFDGTERWNCTSGGAFFIALEEMERSKKAPAYLTHFKSIYGNSAHGEFNKSDVCYFGYEPANGNVDAWKAWLAEQAAAGKPVTITYVMTEPVEEELSADVVAALEGLHTNKPNTTIWSNSGAEVKVSYVADTKAYIDNKFTELQNAILATGANV